MALSLWKFTSDADRRWWSLWSQDTHSALTLSFSVIVSVNVCASCFCVSRVPATWAITCYVIATLLMTFVFMDELISIWWGGWAVCTGAILDSPKVPLCKSLVSHSKPCHTGAHWRVGARFRSSCPVFLCSQVEYSRILRKEVALTAYCNLVAGFVARSFAS